MRRWERSLVALGAVVTLAIPARAGTAAAPGPSVQHASGPRVQQANGITSPPGFNVATFARPTSSRIKPDDITRLNNLIAVTWQNGVGPTGTPGSLGGNSTVTAMNPAGTVVTSWTLPGRCDGLTADPANNRILATVNEDGNTSFFVLRVGAAPLLLTIVDPSGTITGGLDSITVQGSNYYVSTSNPGSGTASVLAKVAIDEVAKTATFSSFVNANATSTDIVAGGSGAFNPALSDPDSNGVVPNGPYAGRLYLVSEGDMQVVFVDTPAASSLQNEKVASAPGDLAWPTSSTGTLYVTDNGTGLVSAISSNNWTVGQPVAASPIKSGETAQAGGFIGALDLTTGNMTPLVEGFKTPVGLLFVPGLPPAGYWEVASDGGIFPFGDAVGYGSTGSAKLNKAMVGMSSMPDGSGYWLVAADGGIFPFGAAPGFGSAANVKLNQPMVGMAGTPDGGGYWLVAADGGIFPFGDAVGLGSTGNVKLNKPIVGMAATPDGGGYWLVAADGGIFPFGDAKGLGSLGGGSINAPIIGMAATPDGGGYWLASSDGTVYPFGSARQLGGTAAVKLNKPIVGMAATNTGAGYWLAAGDGGIFPFGDAQGLGSEGGVTLNKPVVGVAGAG